MRPALYAADWVLPVTRSAIRHGGVLVGAMGRIEAVGEAASMEVGDDVARIDLGQAILLPGLINVHSHPELAGMRGLLEDLPFHAWIPTLRRAKDGAALTRGDFAAAARWTCLEALAAGVTTLAATEDSGAALEALRETGMRGVVFREVFGPDPAQATTSLSRLREALAGMQPLATDLVRVGVSPHAPYTVSDELFRIAAALASAESLPVAVHVAESEAESQLVTAGAGPFAGGLRTRGIATPVRAESPIELLHRTGVLDTRPLLIHCVRTDGADIARIAASGAAVAHCPIANARLGNGIAPVVEMMEAGVTVGLGSDSVAANNRVDILEEARAAQLMQRARLHSAGALPPATLLRMATLEGARALGLEGRVGALEPGMDADLCAVRIGETHTWPVHEPEATLFLSARGSDVVLTMVRGVVLYRDGRHCTDVPDTLRHRLDAMAARMRQGRDAT